MRLFQAITGVFDSSALNAAVWGLAASFALCVLMVLTKRWHGAFTMDSTNGIQKFHTAPTPRIGGVPIVMGLIVAWSKAPVDAQQLLTPILFAGLPAFLFGVAEDITKRVGVLQRLLATMASGLLAWWITGQSLSRVDIWGVDWLLQYTLISALFTAFAVGGVANAINIIDGFNGLASTASTLAFIGYALIAWQVGDQTLAGVALVLAACVWGFFWVNWPFGKIFLGDGGSYFIGFALAWVAVSLIERNPGVSAFAALLVCVHPVTEVLFSIYRRKIKRGNAGHADRMHFHSLLKQRYVRRWFAGPLGDAQNSITGLMVGGMTLTAIVLASLFYDSVWWSAAAFLGLGLGYVAIYARMVRHHWCSPIEFLLVKPAQQGIRVSYADVFAGQVDALMDQGDLLVAISGSGNSPNVIKAIEAARRVGGNVLGVVGYDGGKMMPMCDHSVWVPSFDMQLCEDVHLMFGHMVMKTLCGSVIK